MSNIKIEHIFVEDIVDLSNINYQYKITIIDKINNMITLLPIPKTSTDYSGYIQTIPIETFNKTFTKFIKRSLLQKINILLNE